MDSRSEHSNSEFSIIDDDELSTTDDNMASLPELDPQNFTQVKFEAVSKMENGDYSIIYSIKNSYKPQATDRIALYKLGFVSQHDYLASQWAIAATDTSIPFTVIIDGNEMPRSSAIFYQFCYLNSEMKVMGVSHPINLPAEASEIKMNKIEQYQAGFKSLNEKYQEISAKYIETVYNLQSRDKELVASKNLRSTLEKDVHSKNEEIEELQKALKEQKAICDKLQCSIDNKDEELKSKESHCEELKASRDTLIQEKENLEKTIENLHNQLEVEKKRQNLIKREKEEINNTVVSQRQQISDLQSLTVDCQTSKEASELIAADLSCKLQLQTLYNHELKETNQTLLNKLREERNKYKKFQRNLLISTSSLEDLSEDSLMDFEEPPAPSLVTSTISEKSMENPIDRCSSCSLGAQQLTNSLESKMENIAEVLSSQISSLKSELGKVQAEVTHIQQPVEEKPCEIDEPSSFQSFAPEASAMQSDAAKSAHEVQLPEPLQPETTLTACQAAVMKLVNHSPTQKAVTSSELEEEDYQSVGEPAEILSPPLICPMCEMQFANDSLLALEDHITQHLDFVCPICYRTFDKKFKARFETHVDMHLNEEENNAPAEPLWRTGNFSTLGFD